MSLSLYNNFPLYFQNISVNYNVTDQFIKIFYPFLNDASQSDIVSSLFDKNCFYHLLDKNFNTFPDFFSYYRNFGFMFVNLVYFSQPIDNNNILITTNGIVTFNKDNSNFYLFSNTIILKRNFFNQYMIVNFIFKLL